MATEEPGIRVLNYSPGPVLTDMLKELQQKAWNEDTRKWLTCESHYNTTILNTLPTRYPCDTCYAFCASLFLILTLFLATEKEGNLVTCDATVKKLMDLLDKNAFETGSHVDFYD